MAERLDQIGGHVTSYMQSDIGESFVGTEPQGAMCAKNNVERIEMKSDRTPDPTHVKDKNDVDDESISDESSCSELEKEVAAEGLCSLGKNLPSKKPASMSPDTAEDSIDLEEESSEEEEDTLVHHVKPSAARKLKTRKGKTVVEMMASRTRKKTAGVGPFKSWSKVEIKKRKESKSSDSDEDVEDDVPDISPAKRQAAKKCPGKAAAVHLDNISFHLEDGAAKWKFVIQRRVTVERELGKEAVDVKEVMDLIKNAGLIKTVVALPQCYEGLVKEFVVNIPEEISERRSREFCKVFVRDVEVLLFFNV
ncbi:uncharacterized protein LOC127131508 [Lathyrus oleraceus]|uniref:uncharacterized protein LOC127131508 n=1 Tax=Pisum sativum TaxID=3888 RepID=UPI0021D1F69A|nr:uncharacterized protein LOC127131508 [Pisum sativum]